MNKYNLMLLSAALYLLTGCSTGRVAFKNTVWQTDTGYAVEGRMQTVLQKKPLRFGEFYTTKVKTSWRQSSSYTTDMQGRLNDNYSNAVGMLYERSKSSRRFTLNNGRGEEAEVFTFNKLNVSTYNLGHGIQLNLDWLMRQLGHNTQTENSYYVQVYEPNQDKPWELVLDADAMMITPNKYAGYFALDDQHYYTVKTVNHLMGKNGPSRLTVGCMGYEINDADGNPAAAISLINKPAVYLAAGLSQRNRFLMANLCAALLFYEPTPTTPNN